MDIYTLANVEWMVGGKQLYGTAVWEISSVLCDHLEGWDREGGREMQEGGDMGIYVYI